jgi:hypothetical protein
MKAIQFAHYGEPKVVLEGRCFGWYNERGRRLGGPQR